MNCIEQQEEEIENLKEELKDAKSRLEDHSRDTDLLKKLYDDEYIDINGDPIDRR